MFMRLILLLLVAWASGASVWGQTCHPSARAIFLTQTGVIAPAPDGGKAAGIGCQGGVKVEAQETNQQKKSSRSDVAVKRLEPAVGGSLVKVSYPVSAEDLSKMSTFMFWIELVKPDGEKERVTTDHTFRSGERFQLHVESSVTGHLSVYQRVPDGSMKLLFPDRSIYAGDNLVQARVETIIPPAGRIKFDNVPGMETLIIVLTSGDSGRRSGQLVATRATPGTQEISAVLRDVETVSTRGFVLEADIQPGKESEYAASIGPVAVEIKLKHQ